MDDETLDSEDMLETSEGFESVYHAHSGAIYKFLFWRTKNEQLSEDLASTTFQKAWAARTSFKGGSAQAWLYRIARNTLFDHWRKDREVISDRVSEFAIDDTLSTEEKLDKEAELQNLQSSLAKLPSEMQEVLRLRFIEGLSSKQVASRLNTTDGNVRIIQYRALKKLRGLLQ